MYYQSLPALKLHQMIANDPVAAMRCFFAVVELVITRLLHCEFHPKHLAPDGIAAREQEGLFVHLSSWAAAVEPQARTSLHLHGLVHILGIENVMRFRMETSWTPIIPSSTQDAPAFLVVAVTWCFQRRLRDRDGNILEARESIPQVATDKLARGLPLDD